MNSYFQAEGGLYYRCCNVTTELCVCMKCGNVLGVKEDYNEPTI